MSGTRAPREDDREEVADVGHAVAVDVAGAGTGRIRAAPLEDDREEVRDIDAAVTVGVGRTRRTHRRRTAVPLRDRGERLLREADPAEPKAYNDVLNDRLSRIGNYTHDYDESERHEVEARIRRMFYGAKVEGSLGNIAVIANEAEIPVQSLRQTSTTTKCVAESSATTNVSFPGYKEGWFGRTTGLQIQNTGASQATNVVVTFVASTSGGSQSTHMTLPLTIDSGASMTLACISNGANASLWDGTQISASTLSGVSVTSDQPIYLTLAVVLINRRKNITNHVITVCKKK